MEGNFSNRTRDVISYSREEAIRLGHDYIGTEHLLLGILREGAGTAVKILRNLRCDLKKLRKAIVDTVGSSGGTLTVGNIPLTKQAEKVLKVTYLEAKLFRSQVIGTEHLLLSLLRDEGNIAARVLEEGFSVSYDAVRAELETLIGSKADTSEEPIGGHVETTSSFRPGQGRKRITRSSILKTYSRDVMEKAQADLDAGLRIVGREREIEALARVLCAGRKNALLIGEYGVGKTAIVEGLAQAILEHEVPEALWNHRLLEVDVDRLLVESQAWMHMIEQVRVVIQELEKADDLIIYIKDFDALVGRRAFNRPWVAAMLHQVLRRSAFPCIGAASMARYNGFLQPHTRLEHLFQIITVAPPSDAETHAVMTTHRSRLQARYACEITDEALTAAIELSALYLPDHQMPGRAVDLLNEAVSWASYQQVRERARTLKTDLKDILAKLDQAKKAKDDAVKSQRFEEAAKLRDEQKKWEKAKAEAIEASKEKAAAEAVAVDEETVCQALSHITEIDVEHVRAREAAPSAPGEGEEAADLMETLTKAAEEFLAALRRARDDSAKSS